MAETLIERAWAWLHTTFPERQIYIRSDGRVQFFTFGPTLQATLAGLSLIFLGWVAFASVNVIFKDRIIASKDRRYQQMQMAYENQVNDQRLSYDELNTALVTAEDKFKQTADELEAKQNAVARLLRSKQQVDSTFASLGGPAVQQQNDGGPAPAITVGGGTASDSIGADGPANAPPGANDDGGSSELGVMPQSPTPQPRGARPTKASFIDDAMGRLAGAFFRSEEKKPASSVKLPNHPAFHAMEQQRARIRSMSARQTALLVGVDRELSNSIDSVERLFSRVGISSAAVEQHVNGAMGGPLIPLDQAHIEGIADNAFGSAYVNASAHAKELDSLFGLLRRVPLTTPVRGSEYEQTSDFGARVDPFTRHVAFHPGIDWAGPWGSAVKATAPGTVVFAGPRGGYGNMVEIDHGFGIKTRYGHLSSILVRVGAKVAKGSPVGKLGSTGRSTGPHVHYEIWLADVVRDPSRFIEAGRHVFK